MLEPLAMELRVGCYDREIFTEGKVRPPQPFHLLVRQPRLADVRIEPTYRPVESRAHSLSSAAVQSWVERALAQWCGDDERHQMSLRELDLLVSRIVLPPGWADGDGLLLECYAGTVRVPVELRGGIAWVAAAPERFGLPQPIEISIDNQDGWFRFAIDVYWSPWVEELGRPESPLATAVARLAARGWHPSSD